MLRNLGSMTDHALIQSPAVHARYACHARLTLVMMRAAFSCFADLALVSPRDYRKEGQGSLLQCVLTPAEPFMPMPNEQIADLTHQQVGKASVNDCSSWLDVLCLCCLGALEGSGIPCKDEQAGQATYVLKCNCAIAPILRPVLSGPSSSSIAPCLHQNGFSFLSLYFKSMIST